MWQKNVRYLDYNASSGISSLVAEKLRELLTQTELWVNPSSRHRMGQKVKSLLYQANTKIAKSLGASVAPEDLLITASGTEANQTVIRSFSRHADEILIGAGEHSASYDLLSVIKNIPAHEVPLLPSGVYDFSWLSEYLSQAPSRKVKTIALSLFWANNETGVITDLIALQTLLKASPVKVILHLDGAQVWGKLNLNVIETPADFITFSAHKIGAPAGTGVVWMRNAEIIEPLILGTQSRGLRGGTENGLGIVATGYAAEALDPNHFQKTTRALKTLLESELKKLSVPVKIWGEEDARVSNTTRFSFLQFSNYENWVELLDLKGYAVSHGSACRAQVIEPSRVLLKMGASREEALNSIRVSFGEQNTVSDVMGLIESLKEILDRKTTAKHNLENGLDS